MNIRKAILMSVMIGAFAAVFNVAHADTAATSSVAVPPIDECTPTAVDLKQISAIQNDPTLSYSDEIKSELAARKKLLGATITCAETEAQTLQTALNNVSTNDGNANLQTELSGKLNDAINFYNIELSKLGTVGISGSQAIARDVLAYRTGSYEPLAGEVNNFILWSGNQNLFSTAQTRMGETSRAVSFLESATPNSDLQNAFAAAQTSFTAATNQNKAAQDALMQSLPASQSLSLIQQSLTSLADTYTQFFTVSNLIKTLLPQ